MGAFHEGELALQAHAGVQERMAAAARFIRDHMPEQHREFFTLLPFLIAGSIDAQGQPWASVLAGAPGFVSSPEPAQLTVRARPLPHDPLAAALAPGAPLGLLGIQPHTRRRNRLNGHVLRVDEGGFTVGVDQSFGNCPKYIQAREPTFIGHGAPSMQHDVQRLDHLDEDACSLVAGADTFFIATAHPLASRSDSPEHGIDVSHRGGRPGFVRVTQGSVLTLPDFTGNSFFNTLGNLALNPRCGLLFIDYERGDVLQVAARGEIVQAGPEVEAFAGALRLVRLHVTLALRARRALPLQWSPPELSPALATTGAWASG